MTSDQDNPSEQDSLAGSEELASQVAQLIRLVRSGQEANIEQALRLAKDLESV